METVELTINELYEARAQFGGFYLDGKQIYLGFANEEDISEGVERLARRILKTVSEELDPIDKRRAEIASSIVLQEGEDLELARNKADTEYILSFEKDKTVFQIQVQKIDFTKVAEQSFGKRNYQFIYEKFFNNY